MKIRLRYLPDCDVLIAWPETDCRSGTASSHYSSGTLSADRAICRSNAGSTTSIGSSTLSHVRLPKSMASEGYTLREHIGLVRRAIQERRKALHPVGTS